MGVKLFTEPELREPVFICGWPGIGRIGVLAVDYLRRSVSAEDLGEIEPWDFFNPKRVSIQEGLLKSLDFPSSRFYYKQTQGKDIILFIGEQQPSDGTGGMYATGEKAYRMANMVLDVAQKFKASRIYTSGAAVSQIHHTAKPRIWAVPNNEKLEEEIATYSNTVLMSGGEDRHGQSTITGLNGLLLGVARKRGIDAICLMGEIPYYVQASPFPYPKAAISVLELLSETLGIPIDTVPLSEMAKKMEQGIEGFLNNLYQEESMPEEVRNQIKEMVEKTRQEPEAPAITDEDQRRIMEQLDEFFDQGEGGNDRTS